MKTYGGVEIQLHAFLTSALDGGEWSASRPGHFTPGETAPGTHWLGGWVGPTVDLLTQSLYCSYVGALNNACSDGNSYITQQGSSLKRN